MLCSFFCFQIFINSKYDLGIHSEEHSPLNDRDQVMNVRYRPYNILKPSKKMAKVPSPDRVEIETIPPNGYESRHRTQQFQRDTQNLLQQRRVYGTGFKQRIQIKKNLMSSPDRQVSHTQSSQNSDTID